MASNNSSNERRVDLGKSCWNAFLGWGISTLLLWLLNRNNTDNFSGVPYIEPYNAFRNPVGKGAYWIRDDVIVRDTNGKIYG